MNIDNNAWLTLYQEEFSRTRYIYHFTSIEKDCQAKNCLRESVLQVYGN